MIKFLTHVYTSKRDMYGNCYHAVVITRTLDGKSIEGQLGSANNVYYCLRRADAIADGSEYRETTEVLPIRRFNRRTKSMGYLDDNAIVNFVKGES